MDQGFIYGLGLGNFWRVDAAAMAGVRRGEGRKVALSVGLLVLPPCCRMMSSSSSPPRPITQVWTEKQSQSRLRERLDWEGHLDCGQDNAVFLEILGLTRNCRFVGMHGKQEKKGREKKIRKKRETMRRHAWALA